MRFMSIASGSSGNCIYIGTQTSHILIDAGISGKKTEAGLAQAGLSMKDIDAVCVTHEHNDHISGLGVLARRWGVPIYTMPETWQQIRRIKSVGEIDEGLFRPIAEGEVFTVGDITLTTVPVSHDAAHPVAYLAESGGRRAGVITDLGVYDERILEACAGLDVMLVEANHDIRMLETGPYPYPLKLRILGEKGHLSNESAGQFLGGLLHDRCHSVFLGHLSRENNFPELAYETVKAEITMGDNPYKGSDFPIRIARRDVPSALVEF